MGMQPMGGMGMGMGGYGMGMQPMGGMGMGMQPMGGMGMGMQPMMPMGGGGMPTPVVTGTVRDKEYNEMRHMTENPYPGASGIACDLCGSEIEIEKGFYHSDQLEMDYCLACACKHQS